jgi:hypothetical protein
MNKYLEKIANAGIVPDDSGPSTKQELAQTAVTAGAGGLGTLATDRVGQKLGLIQATKSTLQAPRTFTGKLMDHVTGRSGKLLGIGMGIGTALDYGAVKINNMIHGSGSNMQKEAKKNNSTIHIKPKNKGLLHKKLGISQGKKIGSGSLATAKTKAKASGNVKLEREVVFAENAKKWNHK